MSLHGTLLILTVVAALGSAIFAGVFFAFSVLVMPSLARTAVAPAVGVMQRINVAALRPAFLLPFLGTAVGCAAVAGWALVGSSGAAAGYLITGGVLYLLGDFGLTIGYHVPRNESLDRVDPAGPAAAASWHAYHGGWIRLNHVRAAAAAAAAVCFVIALHR